MGGGVIRQLWCTCCGGERTLDTARPYRNGKGASPLVCLRCGHTVFTADRSTAPVFPPEKVLFTVFDQRLLRSLRIAPR